MAAAPQLASQNTAIGLVQAHATEKQREAASGVGKQGTVLGVVFPCMANILGVLLFLRMPWIVGKAGVLASFCLVGCGCMCTFLTALSLSAVATNGKVAGGGAYFLISRSLGPSLGAGVGLCFYFANSIGAAMYIIGTVEAWEVAQPDAQLMTAGDINNIRVTGYVILAFCIAAVAGGMRYVVRLGTTFLFIVFGVILSMYIGCFTGPTSFSDINLPDLAVGVSAEVDSLRDGGWRSQYKGLSMENLRENWASNYDATQHAYPGDTIEYDFVQFLALWFPACTGIMAGANRSADLADAKASIPKGTLFAQLSTSVIYLSFTVIYGMAASRPLLLHDRFFAASSAWPHPAVVIYGVMASTIGAALASLISACRLLNAIAQDGTLPILKVFAAPQGKEPRIALLASAVLTTVAISIGDLNVVAPIITMFFLLCYFCINMACGMLDLTKDPNWRPTFRFYHWFLSLCGMILCVVLMFLISLLNAVLACLLAAAIFLYATKNSNEVNWGDGFQGVKFQYARRFLLSVNPSNHTKNWRPQILVLTGITRNVDQSGNEEGLRIHDTELIQFCSQLKEGKGLTVVGGVISATVQKDGNALADLSEAHVENWNTIVKSDLLEMGVHAFAKVLYTAYRSEGIMNLIQTAGLGAFEPNCVLSAWPFSWVVFPKAVRRFIQTIQVCTVFEKTVLIAKEAYKYPTNRVVLKGVIDVWWVVADGGLMLLLPSLLIRNKVWKNCRVRIYVVVEESAEDDPAVVKREVEAYLLEHRLSFEVHCVTMPKEFFREDAFKDNKRRHTIMSENIIFQDSNAGKSFPGTSFGKSKDKIELLALNSMTWPGPLKGTVGGGDGLIPEAVTAADAFGADADAPDAGSSAQDAAGDGGRPRATSWEGLLFEGSAEGGNGGGPAPPRVPAEEAPANGGLETKPMLEAEAQHRAMPGELDLYVPRATSEPFPTSRPRSPQSRAVGVAMDHVSESSNEVQEHGVTGPSARRAHAVSQGVLGGVVTEERAEDPDGLPVEVAIDEAVDRLSVEPEQERAGAEEDDGGFVSSFALSDERLTSTKPAVEENLKRVKMLNAAIVKQSGKAQLVITNLPDVPSDETGFGYMQLVEHLTADLERVLLVRGASTEVITAFT
uniref:Uncharacterized protein n=1 Tax=Oxyrrhis marina TaxID=2969 RepID=A0A7S4LQN6_OXYMA